MILAILPTEVISGDANIESREVLVGVDSVNLFSASVLTVDRCFKGTLALFHRTRRI